MPDTDSAVHPLVRALRARPRALAAVLLLAALAACGGGDAPPEEPAAPPEERRARVRVVEVTPETVTDYLDLAADLLPERRAVLAAEVPGTVETLRVEEGQRVAAGQVVATVDTRALEQELAEAQAVHEQAADQHRRAEALFEKRSITRSAVVDAEAARGVAAARLSSARLRLEKSRIEAPWPGVIASRSVEVGDYVVPGQPVVELLDISRLKVRAPVPASDVPFVEVGEPVTIRISSLPGESFEGTVVRLAAELDPSARTLGLEAEISNRDGRLKPGMLARLEIPRRRLPEALLVPLDAVVDLEDRRVVYVVEGGEAARREVVAGPVLGERVVIERGLEPGDRVVIDGQSRIAPGQPVEVVETVPAARPVEPAAPAEDTVP